MPIDAQGYRAAMQEYNHARTDKLMRTGKSSGKVKVNDNLPDIAQVYNTLRQLTPSLPTQDVNNAKVIQSKIALISRLLLLSLINNVAIGEKLLLPNASDTGANKNSDVNGYRQNVTEGISQYNPTFDPPLKTMAPDLPYSTLHDTFSSYSSPNPNTLSRVRRNIDEQLQKENVINHDDYINAVCRTKMKALDGSLIGTGALIDSDSLPDNKAKIARDFFNIVADSENEEIGESRVLAEKIFTRAINKKESTLIGYRTGDVSPFVKYALVQNFKNMAESVDGDTNCDKYKVTLMELATFNLGIDFHPFNYQASKNRAGYVACYELKETIEYQPQGVFIQRRQPSEIYTEKNLSIDYQDKNYLIKERENGELVAYESAMPTNERSVYFDGKTDRIYFDDDLSDGEGVSGYIVNGKDFIKLNDKKYELVHNALQGKYYVKINKEYGGIDAVPVYMNPLSSAWYMEIQNRLPVYSDTQSDIIAECAVPYSRHFDYHTDASVDPELSGEGVIYHVVDKHDLSRSTIYSVIEMKGKLLPVRRNGNNNYEIYNQNTPDEYGYRVEHDGNRWIFYSPSSVHASLSLQALFPEELYETRVDPQKLSGPDHQGLRWGKRENAYLKVNDNYIKMRPLDEERFSVKRQNKFSALRFYNNQFYIESFADRFENILAQGDAPIADNKNAFVRSFSYDGNGVLKALSQLAKTEHHTVAALLKRYGIAETSASLESMDTIEDIMEHLNMDQRGSSLTYSGLKDVASTLPDGRYFAISRAEGNQQDKRFFKAHTLHVKDEEVKFLGNGANDWISEADVFTLWGPYPQ